MIYITTILANELPIEKKTLAVYMLAEGSSIRSVERMTGVRHDTVMRLGMRTGEACKAILDTVPAPTRTDTPRGAGHSFSPGRCAAPPGRLGEASTTETNIFVMRSATTMQGVFSLHPAGNGAGSGHA